MCLEVQLYIQVWADAAHSQSTQCLYGGTNPITGRCDFSDTSKNLTDFAGSFHSSSTGRYIAFLPSGASAYFTIGMRLPTTADNTYQGRLANIDFEWFAQR